MKALRLAAAGLGHSPVRTLLTTLGLANAVAGGLTFYGFTRDTYWGLAESFARSGNGHVQIANAGWFDAPAPEQLRVDHARLDRVRTTLSTDALIAPHLLTSTVRRSVMGMLVANGRSAVFLGQGTDPAAEALLAPLAQPVSGSALDPAVPEGVLLGAPLAARLGVGPGDTVTAMVTTDDGLTNAMDLVVLGTTLTGAVELDRAYVSLPLDTALKLTAGSSADALLLGLNDTQDTAAVMTQVSHVLARPEFLGLDARPWFERATYYVAVRALYDRIFGVFEVLMVAVTLLSLSHAMGAVVTERRAEIALLRVVGLRRRDVAAIFVAEGTLLGLLGCAVGGALAVAISTGVYLAGGIPMPPPPGFSVGYAAQVRLDAIGFAIVLPVTFAAAVLGSALPAWRASGVGAARGLMGLSVVLLAVLAHPVSAAPVSALPADSSNQRCIVDVRIAEPGKPPSNWRLATHGDDRLVVSTSLAAGRRQAVLEQRGEAGGTWFHTEAMAEPLRIGLAQRLLGPISVGDVLDPRGADGWDMAPLDGLSLASAHGLRCPEARG